MQRFAYAFAPSLALLVVAPACADEVVFDAPDAAPQPVFAELPPAPADWLLLFDRSASWSRREDRFDGLKDGVTAFLAARSGDIELAATYFPRAFDANASCDVADFSTAELTWPATNEDVTAALAGWDITSTGSTLGPALEGAGLIAGARRVARPGRSTSIVILTDAAPGEDETCETSAWDAIAGVARDVFAAGRGPNVHVVGVLGTATAPDHPAKVGGIAVAGGGYAAFVNGGQSDIAASALGVLRDLESRAAVCTRALPAGFVPDALTVTSPDGTVTELARAADASACAGPQFFLDDPAAPTTATLCSGDGGIGGVCEVTFLRSRVAGSPTVVGRAGASSRP
ncbi:MAG TPA: hypothetical protein VM261_22655 [Kofleriaceae bacterium]|nr:hypothetical protein [Kofleriaceae bacterium]